MSKFSSFLRRLLPALALVATLFSQNYLAAQNLQVETLPSDINGVAFRGNELWQITTPTLVKRNLATGAVEAEFDVPGGVSVNAPWGTDGFRSIAIGPKGDIWLTLGRKGVARFDGITQWKIWSPQSTPAFPAGIVFFKSAVEAATGLVWMYGSIQNTSYCFIFDGNTWKEDVALRNLHLNRFANGPQGEFVFGSNDTLLLRKNNTWVAIPEPEEGPYNYVEAPVFDPQGRLWVMAKLRKMYRYDDLGSLPKHMTSTDGNGIYAHDMTFDNSGNLYIATYESGLGKWDGTSWTYSPSLAGSTKKVSMSSLATDPLGRLWIMQPLTYASTCALTLWDNGTPQKNFYYGIPQASQISPDRQGNLWFAGDLPLLVRKNLSDGSIDHFEMLDISDEFNYKGIDLKPGVGNEMWLKTTKNKIMHFDGTAWSQLSTPAPPEYINGFCVSSKGRLYASGYTFTPSSAEYELKFLDPGAAAWKKVDFSIFGNWSSSFGELAVDEADNLWFGTQEGLGRRNVSDGSLEIYPLPGSGGGSGSSSPLQVQTGPGGMVYVVEDNESWGNGTLRLLQFNSNTLDWTEIPLPAQPVNTTLVWHADLQGRVWVGVHINTDLINDLPSQYWFWDDGIWIEMQGIPDWAGNIASDHKGNVYFGYYDLLAQLKSAGRVEGTLRNDLDGNCQTSAADQILPNFTVVANDGKNQYLGLSRPDGSYRVYCGSEKVTVQAVPTNPLWSSCDPGGTALTLSPEQPAQLDFLLQAEQDCPHMTVDVSTPFLRRCFDNTYTVRACNDGTLAAQDAYVDITLPAEMEMKSANKPYTAVGPQQYRFPVGDLAVGACAVFQFVTHVSCDNTSIGQTLCVLAHVYPDTTCIQTASAWKGATVLLDARCEGDSVRFSLKNSGTAATSQPVDYQLLRNEAVYSIGSLSLQPGQQRSLTAPADGATWRLSTAQEPAHPFLPRSPSLAVEACALTAGGFDRGFVNSQPNSSGSGFEDLDCQELIGSFDPNDKAASPVGIGENTHFVLPGTQLEYHIRFQNTGTDTAFTVVVRDTLSGSLDFATFEPGASSHSYRLDARGNALAFVFDNILLPDSNVNLAASQGFVQFRIRPRRDIPLGTVLTNSAAIYFDFNAPVLTNTVWHIVDSSFQQTSAVGSPLQEPQEPRLWVFPNPAAQGSFWVKTPAESGTLNMYDAQGRLQHTLRVQGASAPVQVDCAGLPDGLYLLRFWGENHAVAVAGKVVLKGN